MKRFLTFVAFCLFLIGCNDETPVKNSQSLIDSWDWIVSEGGWAGKETPASTNHTARLILKTDSTYTLYVADTVLIQSGFHTAALDAAYPDNYRSINFNNSSYSLLYYIENEFLYLIDPNPDGVSTVYHRHAPELKGPIVLE